MAASASLKSESFVRESRKKNEDNKRLLTHQLDEWGIPYSASEVNYIFMDASRLATQLGDKLKQDDILVAPVTTSRGPWCRITIGTGQDMNRLIASLEKWV